MGHNGGTATGRLAQAPGFTPLFLMLRFFSSLLLLAAIVPEAQAAAFQCGQASFYGTASDGYAWQTMANGKPMNPNAMTAAHPSLPLGSRIRVKNRDNGKAVLVTINDRGPYAGGRVLDLSYGSFSRIASPGQGVANVCISRA